MQIPFCCTFDWSQSAAAAALHLKALLVSAFAAAFAEKQVL